MNKKIFFIICFYSIILCCFPSVIYSYTISNVIPIKLALNVCPIALDNYHDINEQVDFVQGYGYGYKFALIMLDMPENLFSSLDKEKTPYAEGFRLGKVQGLKDIKNNNTKCSLVDFGYEPVTLKGQFFFGFERNEFTTENGKTYWVEVRIDMVDDIVEIGDAEVIVSGYLSSESHYGHMNGYSKEFVVISITKIEK
jgi:hypothetical protein